MNNQRNTVQRQIILDPLQKLKTHPTIDEVYNAIHVSHPSISRMTVYRNLRKLAVNGIIRQVTLSDGLERYDGRFDQHYHFKCKNCGSIFDVDIDYLSDINETVRGKYGFQVEKHDVVFTGVCQKCGS